MNIASLRRMSATAGLAIALLAFHNMGGSAAQAAPAQTGMPQFGSVQLGKILSGYKKRSDLEQQLQVLNERLNNQFTQQRGNDMLTKAEQTELGTLLGKPNQTDADKARITALQAESAKAAQELTALQQKASPTADDTARLNALTQQRQAGQAALQEVADGFAAQVQAERDRLNLQLTDTVQAAIAAVAKDHGLAVVFDAQYAVYTANDITNDVLARLNK